MSLALSTHQCLLHPQAGADYNCSLFDCNSRYLESPGDKQCVEYGNDWSFCPKCTPG